MHGARALFVVIVGLVGCSAAPDGTSGGDLAAVQCRWPASLDDAGAGACHASRTQVWCTDPAGEGCGCASDGAMSCDCSAVVGGGPWTCAFKCAANQYSVACGSVGGAGAAASPPDGCTAAGATPAGIAYYCCPCG